MTLVYEFETVQVINGGIVKPKSNGDNEYKKGLLIILINIINISHQYFVYFVLTFRLFRINISFISH